ncbi:MAG TPA: hypothetical protein VJ732_05320 [Bryobacteraceae bacterium]|nr:hypothetical protein [Bryobacteraceae bacterium]
MVVRIRFGRAHRKDNQKRARRRRNALAVAALLTPAALMASVLGMWRIAADFKWTTSFAISSGPFSHWEVWLGGGAALQLCACILNRYGRSDRTAS